MSVLISYGGCQVYVLAVTHLYRGSSAAPCTGSRTALISKGGHQVLGLEIH